MIRTVNIRSSYTFYRKHYGEGIPGVDYRDGLPIYIDIVNGFMKFMMKKIFEGYDVRLAAKLGVVGIRGKKVKPFIDENGDVKGVAPNWGETKKLQARDEKAKKDRTIVYCFNEHSNGIKYNFYWSSIDVIIINKTYYGFTFSRWNRRELSRLVQEEGKEYIVNDKLKYERVNNKTSN